jgi:5-methylthioribose kinase
MNLSANEITTLIESELPHFDSKGAPQKLHGGNLNHVWRLRGKAKNLIVKIAPPYIAANPEVALNPIRIEFEARALQLFQEDGLLHSVATDDIRPPNILLFDGNKHLLAMEDMGELPDLTVIRNDESRATKLGIRLGRFIGHVHKQTFKKSDIARDFNNSGIQQTRLEVQYEPAAEYAQKAGIEDVSVIKSQTVSLGQKLLNPGCCLIMGDLWPRSILVNKGKLRIIDWEFAHWGRPLQDIGHLAAHCWMQAHTTVSKTQKQTFKNLWINFWETYQATVDSIFSQLFDDDQFRDTTTHIGAEILIRTTGPFKNGYVYQSFDSSHPLIKQAVQKARNLIRSDDFSSLW